MKQPKSSRRAGQASAREKDTASARGGDRASSTRLRRWKKVAVIASATLVVIAGGVWWYPRQRIARARTLIDVWQFEEANQILVDHPWWGWGVAETRFLRARIAKQQEAFGLAADHLRAASAGGFDQAAILREWKILGVRSGTEAELNEQAVTEWVRKAPEDRPAIYEAYALAGFAMGKETFAAGLLDRWASEFPDDGRPLYWSGVIEQTRGSNERAAEKFTRCVGRESRLVDGHMALASLAAEQKRPDQAERHYRNALTISPERVDARLGLAEMLWQLRRRDEAVDGVRELARREEIIFPARLMVAQHAAAMGKPDVVIHTIGPMIDSFEDSAILNYLLSSAYASVGDAQSSRERLEKYLNANRSLDTLRELDLKVDQMTYGQRLEMALAYRRFDRSKSLDWLQLAADIEPANPEIHELISRHHREEGAFAEANREANIAETLSRQ